MSNNETIPQNENNEQLETPVQKREKFEKEFIDKGFNYANRTDANPELVGKGLDDIYQFFLHGQKMDKESIKKRIETLKYKNEELEKDTEKKKAEIEKIIIENDKYTEDINRHETAIEEHKSKILSLDNEILEIKKQDPKKGDETMLNVYGIGAIIALIGVILSYSATLGSALLGLEESDFLVKGDIYHDLFDAGLGILAFVFFISFIVPIGGGFFYTKYSKEKKYGIAYGILLIVLIVDIVIGYLLAKTIYIGEFQQGLHNKEWIPTHIIFDLSFWIVLVLNFALYMIFSHLAINYFTEKEKLNPDFITQQDILKVQNEIDAINTKIDNLREKIEEIRKFISDNEQKIESLKGEIKENEVSIQSNRNRIVAYQNGTIPIDPAYLKQLISKYIEGYSSYVSAKHQTSKEKGDEIMKHIKQNVDIWFNEKQISWSSYFI